MEPGRLRIRSRVHTLGVQAGDHVEIEDTPAVRRKIADGWFVLLDRKALPVHYSGINGSG